jgi:hypothetical protein
MSSKANWHRLPNWEHGHLGRVAKRSQPPPAPPQALKHPRWLYYISFLTKYKKSRPRFPPTSPTMSTPPDHHFWHCLHVFISAPKPCSTAPPYYTPPPSHPAPSAYDPPYPPTQKTLLLIPTSSGNPAICCFFGWWATTAVDL